MCSLSSLARHPETLDSERDPVCQKREKKEEKGRNEKVQKQVESHGGKTFHELVGLPQVQVDSVSAFHRRFLLASSHMIKMGGQLTGTCHKDISIIHSVSVFPHALIISPKTSFLMCHPEY